MFKIGQNVKNADIGFIGISKSSQHIPNTSNITTNVINHKTNIGIILLNILVGLPGFEPGLQEPKPCVTTTTPQPNCYL